MLLENKKGQCNAAAHICAAAAALILSACTTSLEARLSDGSASIESARLSAGFSPAAERVAQSFLGHGAVFNQAAIESAFDAIEFPSPASVAVEGAGGDQLKLEFSRINLDEGIFLTLTDSGTKAFDLDAKKKSLVITLTEETIAKIVAALPQELFEYADLLMAPALTGERMTEDEYLSLIAAAYGPQATADLKSCSFAIAVQCPGEVIASSAREFADGSLGGASSPAAGVDAAASGAEARFAIPAVKVLALSCPLQLEARWK